MELRDLTVPEQLPVHIFGMGIEFASSLDSYFPLAVCFFSRALRPSRTTAKMVMELMTEMTPVTIKLVIPTFAETVAAAASADNAWTPVSSIGT